MTPTNLRCTLAKRIKTAQRVIARELAILATPENYSPGRVRLADKRVLKWDCTLSNYRRALESIES